MSSFDNEDNKNRNLRDDRFYEDLFGISSTATAAAAPPSTSTVTTTPNQENGDPGPNLEPNVHVQHCDRCINVRQCQKEHQTQSKLQSPSKSPAKCPWCPIVACRLGCLLVFHECKAEEHETLLCPKGIVPCINAQHGCPIEMERRWTGLHLQTCPASVVVCTIEWNRKPLAPWQSEHFESWAGNPQHLDIAATRRDEQTVKEYYKHLPQSLRSLLRTNDKKQAIMPLGVAGTRIPKSILAQAAVEKCALQQVAHRNHSNDSAHQPRSCSGGSNSNSEDDDDKDGEEDDSSLISFSEPSYGIRKSPSAGLQQSVCNQLMAGTTTPSTPGASSKPKRKSRVRLSPTVDVVVKDACKYMNLFTFMCAHEFRRDEYAAHFRNVHTEIITQLNGWLWTRCPMALQGCDYGVERMYPTSPVLQDPDSNFLHMPKTETHTGNSDTEPGYEIMRNEFLDSFCVRQRQISQITGADANCPHTDEETDKTENANANPESMTDSNSNVPLSICDLPVEILVHLTKDLDPLSLNALTLTNKFLLSVCQLIVVERGIVVLDWERVDPERLPSGNSTDESDKGESERPCGVNWLPVDKRWMFSTHFTPIRNWRFIEPGHMSNHMASCPYLAQQRNRPSAPFCYPVTKDNL